MTAVPPPAAATRLVLVVDDDAQVRALLARWATIAGHTAVVAVDGRDALDSFARHPGIEAVITDVRMPGIDGPQLVAELRATRPDLPVVFISGFTGLDARPDTRFAPRAAFIEKPFSLRQLTETFEQLVGAN